MASLSSSIAFNSIFNLFGKLSVRAISFLFALLIIRFLGDEGYGQYTLIWSYLTIFAMFSDAGLGMYLTREVAKNKSSAQHLISNIIIIRLILASATTVVILVVTWLLEYPEQFVLRVLFASLVLWLYAIQDPLDALLQGLERFDLAATAVTTGQLVFVAIGVVVLWLGEGIEGLILATLVNVLVSAMFAWLLITNYFENLQWNISPSLWPKFLEASFRFGLIKIYLSWFLRTDMIILAWFWPDRVVGWYGAAYAIILAIGVISNAFSAAVYPSLSKQYAQNPAALSTLCPQILKYLLILTLPIAGLISLTANNLIILLFGVEFAPAATILSILIWVVPLTFFSEFLRYALLVANKEKETSRILSIGILFSIGLNLGLTPRYGPVAAAAVAILAETILVLLYLRQFYGYLAINYLGQVAFKPLVATGILIVTLIVSKPLALVVQYIIGTASYLLAIWLLRVVQSEEIEQVMNPVLKYVGKTHKDIGMNPSHASLKVSVVIPAYNAERFVAQTIESVLAQTYSEYEIIIINDDSTDNTAQVLQQYQHHPKIKIFHNQDNKGVSPTSNMGIKLAQGDLVIKLDADDFYEPEYLATVVEFFSAHQDVGLVFSGVNLLHSDGRREPEMRFLTSGVWSREEFLPTLLELCILRAPTICVRRSCYEKLGVFIEEMSVHADWEMWVRIAANYRIGFIARLLANYRLSYGSNLTVQSMLDGRSIHDMRLWLSLLAANKLPYSLSEKELTHLRWGMYRLAMHFAALASYYGQEDVPNDYITFAEQILPNSLSSNEVIKLRYVHLNLHKGLLAFRDGRFKEARRHFLRAIKTSPFHCRPPWIWSKLLLTFVGRTKWGVMYK